MNSEPSCYTIGHSNYSYPEFFEILCSYDIGCLIDVRSVPYSRYAGQFNKQELRREIIRRGLEYCYEGQALGGRPADPGYHLSDGSVDYRKLGASSSFNEALQRVIGLVQRPLKAALLCSEKDPLRCHRFFLIGRFLEKRGIKVFHICAAGRAVPHFLLEQNRSEDYNKGYSQPTLFELDR